MLGATEQALILFLAETGGDRLLIFKDVTSGRETYSAGRNLDVPLRDTSGWSLMLNPYCAYTKRYRCPLPPAKTKLSVAIRAGKMIDIKML